MKAHEIKHLLAKRHKDDIFGLEVKNGPSWTADVHEGLLILDALAITKSWSNMCITGYEIKVSRNDFLSDNKYPKYKQYCNRLYIVCPKGLIKKEEVVDDCGLICINEDTKALYTAKKAPFRDIQLPVNMFLYMLMNRHENPVHPFFSSTMDYIGAYLDKKKTGRELAYAFHSRMVKENAELHERVKKLDNEIRYSKNTVTADQSEYRLLIDLLRAYKLPLNPRLLERHLKAFENNIPLDIVTATDLRDKLSALIDDGKAEKDDN